MMTVVVVVVLMAMEIVVAAPSCSFCLVSAREKRDTPAFTTPQQTYTPEVRCPARRMLVNARK